MTRRYELTETEWEIIEPLLPNKPRGVPRVNDRRVINGILWRFRTGSPWADSGPCPKCSPVALERGNPKGVGGEEK